MDVSEAIEHPKELILLQHPRPIIVHGGRGEDIEAVFYLYNLIHEVPARTATCSVSRPSAHILSDEHYKIIVPPFEDSAN